MSDVSVVDEAFRKISSITGCKGVMIMNGDGIAIRTTMENELTVHYAYLVSLFIRKARSAIKALDPDDEIQHSRIRSKKHEILIVPDFDKSNDYFLIVIQEPSTL